MTSPSYDPTKSLGERFHEAFLEAWGHMRLVAYADFPAPAQAAWERAAVTFTARLSDAPQGWRPIETCPGPYDPPFLAACRLFIDGKFADWDVHYIALDDETGEIHPDYDEGWRLEDYELWFAPPTLPAPPPKDPTHDQ